MQAILHATVLDDDDDDNDGTLYGFFHICLFVCFLQSCCCALPVDHDGAKESLNYSIYSGQG